MLIVEIINSSIDQVKELDKEEVVVDSIEKIFSECQLTITQKTTIATKKGSIHWHLKKGKEKGVLEVTYWLPQNKLWIEIHQNRRAIWNELMIVELAKCFTKEFGGEMLVNG